MGGGGGEEVGGDGVEGAQEAGGEAVGSQQAAEVVEGGRSMQLQHVPYAADPRLRQVAALPKPVLHQAHQHRDALRTHRPIFPLRTLSSSAVQPLCSPLIMQETSVPDIIEV